MTPRAASTTRLVDGVRIRPIAARDAPALRAFYDSLSETSRRRRFLGWSAGIGPEGSRALCTADHAHREGFVAVAAGEIVGHLCLEPDARGGVEVAIAVADRLQGHGIGRRLLDAGVRWARQAGITALCAVTFADNVPLLGLLRSLGLPLTFGAAAAGTCQVRIELGGRVPAAAA